LTGRERGLTEKIGNAETKGEHDWAPPKISFENHGLKGGGVGGSKTSGGERKKSEKEVKGGGGEETTPSDCSHVVQEGIRQGTPGKDYIIKNFLKDWFTHG